MRFSASILSGAVITALLAGPLAAFAQNYNDPYASAVAALQSAGIIDVPANGNVRSGDHVNRAEALKIIIRAQNSFTSELAHVAASIPAQSTFYDVYQSAWYAPYIELGQKLGLVTGYPDGHFRPEQGVKIEEAIAMVMRTFGEDTQHAPFLTSSELINVPDEWFTGHLSMAIQRNAVMPGTTLYLGQYMTRGQLFDLVYRMRIVSLQHLAKFPGQATNANSQAVQPGINHPFNITIPSLGIQNLNITHPKDASTQDGVMEVLSRGVGHLFSYPGEGSTIVIYGHSSGYPWDLSSYTKIFRTINKMSVGDNVYVSFGGKTHTYQVTKKQTVSASDKTPYEPKGHEELILYTCWPPDSVTQRYLVHAVPVDAISQR